VGEGVVADPVTGGELPADQAREGDGAASHHEERRPGPVAGQQAEDLGGVGGRRPVVEGEVDDPAGARGGSRRGGTAASAPQRRPGQRADLAGAADAVVDLEAPNLPHGQDP
jgi:hypothetical protein